MATVQERLQLKRAPLDKWSIREQLCLASAVACSGDQNWMSVSRSLKMMCGTNRPSDWFSQKSCAAQYGKLLENVETPKRKKRPTDKEVSTWNTVETPGESILRKLTQERMVELNRLIQDGQREYNRTRDEILSVKSTTDENKLREMWQQIDGEEKQREKEDSLHAQWLKEREDRKIELERAWRPATHLYNNSSPSLSPAPSPLSVVKQPASDDMDIEEIKTGASPLLTSLLKSPSTTPSSTQNTIGTTSIIVPSSRVVAPTITNLLTGSSKPNISTTTTPAPTFPKLLFNASLTGPPPYEHSQVAPAQSPSQAAPTLSMLLENKSKDTGSNIADPAAKSSVKPFIVPDSTPELGEKSSVGSPNKDEEQQLMEVFNTLIPDNIELADILTDNNAIILNPDLLAEAEESILESVESLMAEQMEADVFEQTISNQEPVETISTAELVEQLTSTSGFPMGPTSTAKGDDSPAPKDTQSDAIIILDTLNEDAEATSDGSKPSPCVADRNSKDDEQSDFSNDAPLSELFKDKSKFDDGKGVSVEFVVDNQDDADEEGEADSPKERPDVFESDSNEDKSLEIIKRGIHELTELKENESSDNSNDASPKPIVSSAAEDFTKPIALSKLKEDPMEVQMQINNKQELVESIEISGEEIPTSNIEQNMETNEENAVLEESSKEKDTSQRKISTNSSDVETMFEDAKESLQEDEAPKPDQSNSIENTDDESHDEKPQRPTKRDYTRRKIETIVEKQRTDDVNILHPDDSSKSLIVGSRMRLKDRDRSESPYVDDGDADSTHSRSKRRYSSTPVMDSMPNSPASSNEDNREYRAWKKLIYLVLNKLAQHKFSSAFLKPITEEQAPSYKDTILRPMDLQTLKRNVDSGLVRTTVEFQRDIMLMYNNAIMYNYEDPAAISAAQQWGTDALQSLDAIIELWRKENEKVQPGGGGPSSLAVRPVASPVPAVVVPVSSSNSAPKPVRGRKSHRVSAGQQPSNLI